VPSTWSVCPQACIVCAFSLPTGVLWGNQDKQLCLPEAEFISSYFVQKQVLGPTGVDLFPSVCRNALSMSHTKICDVLFPPDQPLDNLYSLIPVRTVASFQNS
jgi:hypothetical protein